MIAHMKLALLLALFVAIIAVVNADRYDDCRGGWHVPGFGSLAVWHASTRVWFGSSSRC